MPRSSRSRPGAPISTRTDADAVAGRCEVPSLVGARRLRWSVRGSFARRCDTSFAGACAKSDHFASKIEGPAAMDRRLLGTYQRYGQVHPSPRKLRLPIVPQELAGDGRSKRRRPILRRGRDAATIASMNHRISTFVAFGSPKRACTEGNLIAPTRRSPLAPTCEARSHRPA